MTTLRWLVLDFETASGCDLRKSGAWRYAEDPTTEIICLAYSIMGEPAKLWKPGDDTTELISLAKDEAMTFIAHNAGFEKAIWRKILIPDYGFPDVPNTRWHDTMAVCAMRVLPQNLEDAAGVLNLPIQKDMAGSRLTRSLSKPNKRGVYDRSETTLQAAYAYCVTDIKSETELHKRLGWLPPGERSVWLLDQRINERGVRLDLDFVRAAQLVVDRASKPLLQEFNDLTGGLKVTQGEKLKDWIRAQGVPFVHDLTKERLVSILGSNIDGDEDDEDNDAGAFRLDLPPVVHRVLSIRQLIGSASIKKLARMELCVSSDGRARGLLQYHGAGPGRWAGRLLQPQNFPRGSLKLDGEAPPPELVVEAIMSGDPDVVELLLGSPPVEAVVSGLRHALTVDPGREFVSGDFSTIELRVNLALAGQEDKIAMLAAGQNAYVDMAQRIYKRPIDKKRDLPEYQTGKNCFAADTLVLTSSGVHPITEVKLEDQLWDGKQWVTHQGLISRGWRPTLTLAGVAATAEHPVAIGEQWYPWASLVREESILCRALAYSFKNLPLLAISTARGAGSNKSWSNALAGENLTPLKNTICTVESQPGVIAAPRRKRAIGARNSMGTLISFLTKAIGFGYLIEFQPVFSVVTTKPVNSSHITVSEGFSFTLFGGQIAESFCATWSLLTGGTGRIWNWIASRWTKDTSQVIYDLLHDELTWGIDGKCLLSSAASWSWKPVFDLANAGPRQRFTILTNRGPLLVHNSVLGLGFQMGWPKFKAKYARDRDDEFAQEIVRIFRKEWAPNVPSNWYDLEAAAVRTVHDKTPHEALGVEYRLEDDWLTARLPSGRKLWYCHPRPCRKAMLWDETDIRLAWTYEAMKKGRWTQIDAFGGLLTENVVQALARDLMVAAMFKCEKNGLPVVLTVHDEIVTEPEKANADEKALQQIMGDAPDWAKAMKIPIATETWHGDRYRK